MSLGITPKDFVQQVLYTQEKVLLDFYPSDDKYKEVLTEANMVIQELQKEEDWLWLRQTKVLGVTSELPNRLSHFHSHWHCWPFHRHITRDRLKVPLTKDIYKPSTLYGDCVRLCNYHFKNEFIDSIASYYIYWNKVLSNSKTIEADKAYVYVSNVDLEQDPRVDKLEYGGTYPYHLNRKSHIELRSLIESGKWYLDIDGKLYLGSMLYSDIDDTYEPSVSNMPHVIYVVDSPDNPYTDELIEFDKIKHPKILWDDELTNFYNNIVVHEFDYIRVPYVSAGNMHRININQYGRTLARLDTVNMELGCTVIGNEIIFNRPLLPFEMNRVVVMDAQVRIKPFHICNDNCIAEVQAQGGLASSISYPNNPCHRVVEQTNTKMLTEVPDPNYVVIKTAQYHAQGSPFSQGIIPSLQDQAQKILSSMRSINAAATAPDSIDWCPIDYIEVI